MQTPFGRPPDPDVYITQASALVSTSGKGEMRLSDLSGASLSATSTGKAPASRIRAARAISVMTLVMCASLIIWRSRWIGSVQLNGT